MTNVLYGRYFNTSSAIVAGCARARIVLLITVDSVVARCACAKIHVREGRCAASVYARVGHALVDVNVANEPVVARSTLTLPQIWRGLNTSSVFARIRETNIDLVLASSSSVSRWAVAEINVAVVCA